MNPINDAFISDASTIKKCVEDTKRDNPHLSREDARTEATRRLGGASNFDGKALMVAVDEVYPQPAAT